MSRRYLQSKPWRAIIYRLLTSSTFILINTEMISSTFQGKLPHRNIKIVLFHGSESSVSISSKSHYLEVKPEIISSWGSCSYTWQRAMSCHTHDMYCCLWEGLITVKENLPTVEPSLLAQQHTLHTLDSAGTSNCNSNMWHTHTHTYTRNVVDWRSSVITTSRDPACLLAFEARAPSRVGITSHQKKASFSDYRVFPRVTCLWKTYLAGSRMCTRWPNDYLDNNNPTHNALRIFPSIMWSMSHARDPQNLRTFPRSNMNNKTRSM